MSEKPSKVKGLLQSAGEHFGIVEDDKLSTRGLIRLGTQTVFVTILCTIALSFEPAASMATDIGMRVLLGLAAAVGISLGTKTLIGCAKACISVITSKIASQPLKALAHTLLLLVAAGGIMLAPGAFFFLIAKAMPAFLSFPGWTVALTAGFQVLAADTILGGFTGISLVFGRKTPIV